MILEILSLINFHISHFDLKNYHNLQFSVLVFILIEK